VEVIEVDRQHDIVVIGGGIAGLVSAAYAARAGAAVLVLDRHELGGRARTTDRDGFRFNQGAHALYETGELRAALDELDVSVTGGPASLDVDVIVDGVVQRFPTGTRRLASTHAVRSKGRVALGALFARLLAGRGGRPVGRTVDEWFADLGLPEDAAALLHVLVHVATFVDAPDLLDAGAAADQLRRAVRGVRYLDGGWQTIVDGLADVARASGVRIVEHAEVTAIERGAHGWTVGTRTSEHRGTSVVLAGGSPSLSARLLDVDVDGLGEPGPPVRAACLDLGLADLARHTALFSADEPLYFSTHMPPARLGPDGTVVAHALRYLAPDEHPPPRPASERLWAHARAAGVGDGGATVLADRYLHDMTVAHGLPLARLGGLAGRPSVAVDGCPGAFLAGDWVGTSGMLSDAAAASAKVAASLAVEHVHRSGSRLAVSR
jgi:phytoene dehydrogenase-like protein